MLMTKYARGRVTEGGNKQNGPRQCWMHLLALGDFFFFFVIFATNEDFIAYITSNLQNMWQRSDRGWWWPKRAQTTHLASFGRFGHCHPLSLLCHVFCKLEVIYAIKFLLVAKMTRKKKKSPSAQTMHPASSGPVLLVATLRHSTSCVFCH